VAAIAVDLFLEIKTNAVSHVFISSLSFPHNCPNVTNFFARQIKTTQPRRYLVRPNQGLIAPGASETVQILLVDKDKASLLQSYQRLGQSALDHCKDKFLVQSTPVTPQFVSEYAANTGEAGYEKLTALWTAVTSTGSTAPVANKKLHVRHVAGQDGGAAGGGGGAMPNRYEPATAANPADMSSDQLLQEVSNLRRKYDELVAFSVNLTAERDILNNTLEQTKRDLNRELLQKNSLMQQRGGGAGMQRGGAGGQSASKESPLKRIAMAVLVAAAFFVLGVRMEHAKQTKHLKALPVVGPWLTPSPNASTVEATSGKKRSGNKRSDEL